MSNTVVEIGGKPVLLVSDEGPLLGTESGALDLIGETYGLNIEMIAVPAARLGADFFRLRTGAAGAFIQKLRNYQQRVAILGDISDFTSRSAPLADFVRESNRGHDVLFLPDLDALRRRLGSDGGTSTAS